MKLIVITLLLSSLFTFEVYAEAPSRHEVQGGLAVQSDTAGDWMAGFDIGYTYFIQGNFGLTTDFRGQYRDRRDFYQWLAGPRYTFNRDGRVAPFVQALVGASHLNVDWYLNGLHSWSTTQFVAGGGFGLDIKLSGPAYIRPFQLDFLRQMGDLKETQVQYTLGMAFRF